MALPLKTGVLFLPLLVYSLCVASQDTAVDKQRSVIEKRLRQAFPATPITAISESVITGLHQIITGQNIYYTDSLGRYLVVGHIYDLKKAQDITQQQLDRLSKHDSRIDPSLFPDAAAFTIGQGNQTLTVLFDPNCGWCRRLYGVLQRLKAVRVRLVFSVPETLFDTVAHSLCADQPEKAVDALLAGKPIINQDDAVCLQAKRAALARVRSITHAYGIAGTPQLIAGDGRVKAGFISHTVIQKWLKAKVP